MQCILFYFLFIFLISETNEGPCAITTKVEKYTDCRDKSTLGGYDVICCYLESGKDKRCVEVRREDIKKDKFKKTKDAIKAGTYDFWLNENYTGFDEYKSGNYSIRKIDSLRCKDARYLKIIPYLLILFILF